MVSQLLLLHGLTSLHWHLAFLLMHTYVAKVLYIAQLQMTGLNPAEGRPLGDLQEGDHMVG